MLSCLSLHDHQVFGDGEQVIDARMSQEILGHVILGLAVVHQLLEEGLRLGVDDHQVSREHPKDGSALAFSQRVTERVVYPSCCSICCCVIPALSRACWSR